MDDEKCLVLFSGGRDSFITACKLLQNNKKIVLISFNGGAVACEIYLKHGADRIIKRFGANRVEYVGIYPTTATIQRLNENWIYMTQKELGENYPNMTNCQFQCLHCQTAMWMAAIAYCKAKGINKIAAGYKKTDTFCTGNKAWIDEIKFVVINHHIRVELPMWDFDETTGLERELEMERFGFVPTVLEPKCLMGRPTINGISDNEKSEMVKYFQEKLIPNIDKDIERLVTVFKTIKLGNTTFEPLDYDFDKIYGDAY